MITVKTESEEKLTYIKNREDAKKLLDQIKDKDIVIRLWDEMDDNCLINVHSDPEFDSYVDVEYIDSVNDGYREENEFYQDVVDLLYKHRKHVNDFIKKEYNEYTP